MTNLITREKWYQDLFDRQGVLTTDKFIRAKVAVCGLGGLGSSIAISLARSGIGNLHLIDFDLVELSNIHRQEYRLNQIGKRKTDALSELIGEIAPFCQVKLSNAKLSQNNISSLLTDDDYICEAFDKATSKAALAEIVRDNWPEKILVMASGMAGFSPANEIKTKKIGENFFICGDQKSDLNQGLPLVSPRVKICANHQALLILQLILEKD
ncbi:MAG: sulfur carrier protein ThiS adenylyltransferase ThiF [Bacillota bacterium]|nr:sulfur carrier protein ThiS adenylyltransferase ThiF [Bacillota bacterium]